MRVTRSNRLFALGGTVALIASGCVFFAPPRTTSIANGESITGIAVGDVTGDGIDDPLVLTASSLTRLGVCGINCFTVEQTVVVEGASGIVAADFDGDGIDDVAIGVGDNPFIDPEPLKPGAIEIYYGSADAPSRAAGLDATDMASYPSAGLFEHPPAALRTGDLNGDGNTDVVVDYYDETAYHPGDGAGALGTKYGLISAPAANQSLLGTAIGDFDGDGDDDLAFNGVSILGTASGVVSGEPGDDTSSFSQTPAGHLFDLVAADLDGDGIDDLVATAQTPLQIRRSTGSAFVSFPGTTTYPTAGTGGQGIAFALDIDNNVDLVITSPAANTVSWWTGNGAGGFKTTRLDQSVDAFTRFIAVGDVTGDGRPDVFLGHGGPTGPLSLLTNVSVIN